MTVRQESTDIEEDDIVISHHVKPLLLIVVLFLLLLETAVLISFWVGILKERAVFLIPRLIMQANILRYYGVICQSKKTSCFQGIGVVVFCVDVLLLVILLMYGAVTAIAGNGSSSEFLLSNR